MTGPVRAKAVVMRAYGPPEVLRLEEVELPPLAPTEVRVRMQAAAVNHSDLQIRAGNWPIRKTPAFPYIPGLEVIGEVAAVGAAAGFLPGEPVITMMQGLGGIRARRGGGYQEVVTVGAEVLARLPGGADPVAFAALGLAAVTAYHGLARIAGAGGLGALAGRRIAVSGATGGVGSAGVGIARAAGAAVTAIVSRPEQFAYVRSLGAGETALLAEVPNGTLGSETLDGLLDNVGGAAFEGFVEALKPGGVLSVVGAVGGGRVSLDAYRLLEVTLTGYPSETLDGSSLQRAVDEIAGWLANGRLVPPAATIYPLAEAAEAHRRLEARGVTGRLILVPG